MVSAITAEESDTQARAHTRAVSTDGHYVFSGGFYLSLSFFMTIFIMIMTSPEGAVQTLLNSSSR